MTHSVPLAFLLVSASVFAAQSLAIQHELGLKATPGSACSAASDCTSNQCLGGFCCQPSPTTWTNCASCGYAAASSGGWCLACLTGYSWVAGSGCQLDVTAIGDPHLTNMRGEHFDLLQSGTFVLLQIPQAADAQHTLLRVEASVRQSGLACADSFIKALNMTGKWADEQPSTSGKARAGGLQYHAQPSPQQQDTDWMRFGRVDVKVAWGQTKEEGIDHLNFFARRLGQVGLPVGGLLGEDDHEAAATPSSECKLALGRSAKTPREAGAHGGSIAEASLT